MRLAGRILKQMRIERNVMRIIKQNTVRRRPRRRQLTHPA